MTCMRSLAVLPGQAGSLKLIATETPSAKPGEVLVRTLEVGLCGTDATIAAGGYGRAPTGDTHLVIGHEVLGMVETSVDPDIVPGTLVTATVRRPCKTCQNCKDRHSESCSSGEFTERGILSLQGFASDYFVELPANLITVPPALGRNGVLAEPMSVAQRGYKQSVLVGGRQGWAPTNVWVLGVGAIGIMTTIVLRLRGIKTTVFGRRPSTSSRADLVRSLGAQYASTQAVTLKEVASSEGRPDLILEAAASPQLTVEALEVLGTNGVACLRGITKSAGSTPIADSVLLRDFVLENKAVFGVTNAHRQDWLSGLEDLDRASHVWPGVYSDIIQSRCPVEQYQAALASDAVKATVVF